MDRYQRPGKGPRAEPGPTAALPYQRWGTWLWVGWIWLGLWGPTPRLPEAQANVYATGIALRVVELPGGPGHVEIRYILNEPATAGVTIEVLQGMSVVRRLTVPAGQTGALRGENLVVWDGRDDQDRPICCGTYRVRITTAAHGYDRWTQISDDFDPGQYVYAPTGIGVVRNPNSPYYGRVLVANGRPGPNAEFLPADRPGLLKFHADGSEVPEGSWTDAGHAWLGDGQSPGELEIAPDGAVYVWDRTRQQLLRMDPEGRPGSVHVAWDAANLPVAGALMSGFALSPAPTGLWLWMAQPAESAGPGVYRWGIGPLGTAAPGDRGQLAIRAGPGSDLSSAPSDVAVGPGEGLFATQWRSAAGDPAPRVLGFPAWTNPVVPLERAVWSVGQGQNDLRGATSIAVDPSGRHVAVAFRGVLSGGRYVGGRVVLFDAATGAWVATLPGTDQEYSDVDWDAAGNLYVANLSESVWRVYSPPGPNAATTLSWQTVTWGQPLVRPVLVALGYESGWMRLGLQGQTNTVYVIEGSWDLRQWTAVTNVTLGPAPGQWIHVAAPGPRQFYRARPMF